WMFDRVTLRPAMSQSATQIARDDTWWKRPREFPAKTELVGGPKDELGVRTERANGTVHGRHTYFYPDGRKLCEDVFREGKAHGPSVSWYEDGKVKVEGEYVDGKPHGLWTTYRPDGSVEKAERYEGGKVVVSKAQKSRDADAAKVAEKALLTKL